MIKLALAFWLATGGIEPPALGTPPTAPSVPTVGPPALPSVPGPLDPKPPAAKAAPKAETAPSKSGKRKAKPAADKPEAAPAEPVQPTAKERPPVVHPEPVVEKPAPAKPALEGPAPAKPEKPASRSKAAKKTSLAEAVAGPPPLAPSSSDEEEDVVAAPKAPPGPAPAKNAGESRRKAHTSPPTRDRPAVVLPSLTSSALRSELSRGTDGAQSSERTDATSDRARMEQLAAEIAQARESLRQETAHLEAALKQQGATGSGAAATAQGATPAAPPPRARSKEDEQQIILVSKAMKGMKPAEAAAVLSHVDRSLAAEVLRLMRPADAGAVMAALKPELAAELATDIATRKPSTSKKGGVSQ